MHLEAFEAAFPAIRSQLKIGSCVPATIGDDDCDCD